MKKLLFTLLLIGFCQTSFAADFTAVTDENIKTFIKILPQYVQITEKYGTNFNPANPSAEANQMAQDLNALFTKYSITGQDFATLVQKITLGMAKVEMRQNGIGEQAVTTEGPAISDQELTAIEKNMETLQKAFEMETPEEEKAAEEGTILEKPQAAEPLPVMPATITPEAAKSEALQPEAVTPSAITPEAAMAGEKK